MAYWHQIASYPSLVFGPILFAALVSGVVSFLVGRATSRATSADIDRKIAAERETTTQQINHELATSLTERAWADYSLRRDIYLDLAKQIGCLFEGALVVHEEKQLTTSQAKALFHETARKVRLIGNDDVVQRLNALTSAIKSSAEEAVTSACYSALMNAIRKDIRTLNSMPPIGTELDESAFPIEG